MDLFSRALYVEPSFVGYVGAGLMHAALWIAVSSYEWGAIKHFKDWMLRRHAYLYKGAITENHQDEELVEMFGFKEDPAAIWLANLGTLLHHGVAGFFMLVGIVMGKPWIWRHGLLTQFFGMDILDFVRIIWCKLFPPGPFPMCKQHTNPQVLGFLFFHHTVSLLAGLPGSFYLSDNSEFQWLGVLLAGGPAAFMLMDTFVKCAPKSYRKLHMASGFYCACMFAFQRIVLFLPMAWNVTQAVYIATMPFWAKLCLYVGGANMTVFNFICVLMCFHGWAQKFVLPKKIRAAGATEAPAQLEILISPEDIADRTRLVRKTQDAEKAFTAFLTMIDAHGVDTDRKELIRLGHDLFPVTSKIKLKQENPSQPTLLTSSCAEAKLRGTLTHRVAVGKENLD